MPKYSEWFPMSLMPNYDGNYDVQTNDGVVPADFIGSQWTGPLETYLRWRGRQTKVSAKEGEALRIALGRYHESPQFKIAAAAAAVCLARGALERAIREGRRTPSKSAIKFYHIARALGEELQVLDENVLTTWWPKLKPESKAKLEVDVETFLRGYAVTKAPKKII